MSEETLQLKYSAQKDIVNILERLREQVSLGRAFECSISCPKTISINENRTIVEAVTATGLRRTKTVRLQHNICFYFERPPEYILVEKERERLGYWGNNANAPRYSVCVCNYNMDDTLEVAMTSVLEQLDPGAFEVLVVDDGSTDGSLEVLKRLKAKFANFRFITLERDRKRKLGWTRNISILAARGQYVLLHIDADDQWEPYLTEFVELFHELEIASGKDFHLSGQQTGIGKRDLLLKFGPFENVYRCEDRNLMMKLANRGLLLFMDYSVYRKRLSRPKSKQFQKSWTDLFSQMLFELRQDELGLRYFKTQLLAPFKQGHQSFKIRVIRALWVIPMFFVSRFYEKIENEMTWAMMREYHEANRGNFNELMEKLGAKSNYVFRSPTAQDIFLSTEKSAGFTSIKTHKS